jgi:hypothetical protein
MSGVRGRSARAKENSAHHKNVKNTRVVAKTLTDAILAFADHADSQDACRAQLGEYTRFGAVLGTAVLARCGSERGGFILSIAIEQLRQLKGR